MLVYFWVQLHDDPFENVQCNFLIKMVHNTTKTSIVFDKVVRIFSASFSSVLCCYRSVTVIEIHRSEDTSDEHKICFYIQRGL